MDLYLDFFEDPPAALQEILASQPVRSGILAFILAGTSLLFSIGLFQPLPSPQFILWAIVLWGGFKLVSGLLTACVVHFVAGRPGDTRACCLFVLLGLSELVWTLLVPIALLSAASRFGAAGWVLAFMALTVLSFWLKIRSVHDLYAVSWLKAGAAVASSYALFAAAFLAGSIVWLWGLGSLTLGWLS